MSFLQVIPRAIVGTPLLLICVAVAPIAFKGAALLADVPSAALSGRILDAEKRPVAGAAVTLYLDDVQAKPRAYKELRRIETADSGRYVFGELPEGWYLVAVERDGDAKTFRYFVLEAGSKLSHDFVLRRPVASAVSIRDEAGRPIEAARVRTLDVRDENGEFWIRTREGWQTFGQSIAPSDEAGRLRLPNLPEGAKVTAIIDHDDFAPVELKEIAVGSEFAGDAVMRPGAAVSLSIAPDENGATVSEVEIDFQREPYRHPSSVRYDRLPVNGAGAARLTVEPGAYASLWLKHRDFLVSPWYSPKIMKGEFLRVVADQKNVFSFRLHRKVKVRGRVLDATTGEPMAKVSVQGEIPNLGPDGTVPEGSDAWMHAGWADTDEQGEYSLDLAAGPARVSFQGEGYVGETEHLEFSVAPDGSTVTPELRVRPMPKVAGRVIDSEGRPVAGVVVRFRGELRHVQPVATDAEGRFELAPPWVPVDLDTKESKPEQPLVAFHPYERLSARTTLRLTDADSLGDLTLTLGPERPGSLLDDFREELSLWERGEAGEERRAEAAAATLKGQAAPDLVGTWLNTAQPADGLVAFRGKYVLLDFWFIGCGPCHQDFPSMKLLNDLYKDRGLVVVAVHDNSALPEAVREHAAKEGLSFPILVDRPDGPTVGKYEGHGLGGYPSHILIGPDGTVIDDDRTIPGPSLRVYKIEVVRELLLK